MIPAPHYSPPHRWLWSVSIVFAALILSAPVGAEDAVVVLPHGGASDARVLDVATDDDVWVRDRGRLRLVHPDIGPVVMRDLKILPDGSNLLADAGGRGVAITDSDGEVSYAVAPAGTRHLVTSASVLAYAAPGEPSRILVTDSNRSEAFVVDPDAERLSWHQSYMMPGARATFAQAIALPGQQAAIAVQWPALHLSAIDVYRVAQGTLDEGVHRLASRDHGNADLGIVVVPELEETRDLMGLENGHLLVTTRYKILELTPDGDLVWSVDIGDSTQLRGEFASARRVESGRIAVATFEPGVWTNPHTNHRVHWLERAALDQDQLEVFATSGPLQSAPVRLEPAGGHGGSGSVDYRPGLDMSGSGELSQLELSRVLSLGDGVYHLDEIIWASAQLENTGAERVSLTRASIVATAGACDTNGATPVSIAEAIAVEISSGEQLQVQGSRRVDEAFFPGPWCARVRAQSAQGDVTEFPAPVDFEVVAPTSDTGSTIEVRDLGHQRVDGADAGPGGDVDPGNVEQGCACSAPASGPPGTLGLLLIAGFLLRHRYSRCSSGARHSTSHDS